MMKMISIDIDVHRLIESQRLDFDETPNDILKRMLVGDGANDQGAPERRDSLSPAQHASASYKQPVAYKGNKGTSRARGLWTLELEGERVAAMNMKDAYRALLLALHERSDMFLEEFSKEKARSRYFVARDPAQLHVSAPHLARQYASRLDDEWWFDTNLSAAQVAARAKIAARVAGLLYGRDVKLLDNFKLLD